MTMHAIVIWRSDYTFSPFYPVLFLTMCPAVGTYIDMSKETDTGTGDTTLHF